MKISAIICEYNPFHAGHLYHIERTRQQTSCDHVIAIMSGSFVQRGLPAIFDKWTRTDAALACGADLVLELPQAYACASAERFAWGGVRLAELTGITDILSFGCETSNLSLLQELSALFVEEPDEYKSLLKKHLADGVSYAKARALAAESYIPVAEKILSQSNAILAIEYLKALKRLSSSILPCPVLRAGTASEQTETVSGTYSSALSIRSAIQKGEPIPDNSIPQQAKQYFQELNPIFAENLFDLLLYRLRTITAEQLASIAEISEGLEHKILSAAKNASTFDELLSLIKSKRYPQSRLQRILINVLLGVTTDLQKHIDTAPYIRVLGVKKESRHLLSLLSDHAQAPVIISPAGINNPGLELDILAENIRSIVTENKNAGRDYTEKLHIL